jgi:hypothetical protein
MCATNNLAKAVQVAKSYFVLAEYKICVLKIKRSRRGVITFIVSCDQPHPNYRKGRL